MMLLPESSLQRHCHSANHLNLMSKSSTPLAVSLPVRFKVAEVIVAFSGNSEMLKVIVLLLIVPVNEACRAT
jgi:hypothetical protein